MTNNTDIDLLVAINFEIDNLKKEMETVRKAYDGRSTNLSNSIGDITEHFVKLSTSISQIQDKMLYRETLDRHTKEEMEKYDEFLLKIAELNEEFQALHDSFRDLKTLATAIPALDKRISALELSFHEYITKFEVFRQTFVDADGKSLLVKIFDKLEKQDNDNQDLKKTLIKWGAIGSTILFAVTTFIAPYVIGIMTK